MNKWKDIELVQRKDWNLVYELKDDFKLLVEEEFIRFLVWNALDVDEVERIKYLKIKI